MKILMISDVYFPRINGVSSSIETFRKGLLDCGMESTLVAPAYQPEQTGVASDPDGVVRIPARKVPFDPEDRLMHRRMLDQWLAGHAAGFDLVHIQTPFLAHYAGVKAARAAGLPVLASYHTYFEEYLHHYIPLLPRSLTRAAARRFSRAQCNDLDAVIVPSRAMEQTLHDYGVSRPLQIIPTGLREQHFLNGDGAGFRFQHGIDPARPLLLFVGRVAFEKNIGFLLEVVEQLRRSQPEVLLLITGEGPAQEGLRADCERRALSYNVRFMGYLDRSHSLADCYQAADLFVFASRTETQGLVLLEAMAQGKPVVALSAMGTRDILENTPGAVIARDDVLHFSQCVGELLQDRARLIQLGRAARASAERWSGKEMAQRVAALYESIDAQHHRPARSARAASPQGVLSGQDNPLT
ncbi:glycosyltransferase [Uliginosibacterium paludis]|uniref:Glycosyltransferase n=1 Tax=Uliginosibacterium paludis TaxID=1615952 RepID=A0ABV2CVW8_9RHOO